MDTTYWSQKARTLTPYVAGEQPKDTHLIKLNTNENPYPPSPRIRQAVEEAMPLLRLYPDANSTALCEAIAAHHNLPEGQVFVGNGSDEVLAFAFSAFFWGDALIAPSLTYSFYPVYAKVYDVDYLTIPIHEDFSIPMESLQAGTHVALANPNAPTSRFLPLEDIRQLAKHCLAHGKVLLVDEAYAVFCGVTAIPLIAEFPNLLVVRTLSKSHGLAGLRVGYALGQPPLMEALRRMKDSFNSYPLDRLAQAAARAAIMDAAYTDAQTKKICRTRDAFSRSLADLGFEVPPSGANFVFARLPGMSGEALQAALRARNILVRRFGAERIRDYLRISIGTDGEMQSVVEALREILAVKA